MAQGRILAGAVAVLLGTLTACGRGGAGAAEDTFTPPEAEFAAPPAGKVHIRAMKQRDGAPPARDADRLAAAFLPGVEGAGLLSHEFSSSAPARFVFEIGDRIDLRPEPDFPRLGDATAPPAVFVRFTVTARAGEPFVVLVGHGGLGASSVRAVVAGPVDAFECDGATQYQPRAADPATGLPAAYVVDRDVPEAFRPGRSGVFARFPAGAFGSYGAWLNAGLPSNGWLRIGSWISVPVTGSSRGGVDNDLRTFASGDIDVRCDPIEMIVTQGGAPCEWSTYPHAFWTVRMRTEPAAK